jgi:hypothetical protein
MAVTKKKPNRSKELDEFESVTRWRFDALRELGFQPDQAISLIEIPDVVHSVQALIDRGCPPNIIVSLLRGD